MHAIERQIAQQDWITFVVLFAILLLSILKFLNPKVLHGFFTAFFTESFIIERIEDNPSLFSVFDGITLLFSTISISLGITFILNPTNPNILEFLIIFGGLVAYKIIRSSIDIILEKTFKFDTTTQYFRFSKFIYFYTIGLWFFPVIIIYHYGFHNQYLLISTLVTLAITRLVLIERNNIKLIFNSLFYFILYICTLEIVPLLILYKTITV